MAISRVQDQAAYVLHRYDWSESSLILDIWSRDFGRLAVVAKGAKKPASQFRPILLPLQPLWLSWRGDAEVRTLRAAQWQGGAVMPQGEALLTGFYLNELLLRLLARDDPHPRLFDIYDQAVRDLSGRVETLLNVARAFELFVLRDLGVLPTLSQESAALTDVVPEQTYRLRPQAGLMHAPEDAVDALTGAQWQGLERAMQGAAPWRETVRACQGLSPALRPQLRALLQDHSGVSVFKTRQMWLDVNALGQQTLGQPVSPATL
jgi:DNA repair protein RecO (recombination protein O)